MNTLKSVRLYTSGGRDVLVSLVDDPADPDGRRIEVEPVLDLERLHKVLLVGVLALAADRPEPHVEVLLDGVLGVADGGDTRHKSQGREGRSAGTNDAGTRRRHRPVRRQLACTTGETCFSFCMGDTCSAPVCSCSTVECDQCPVLDAATADASTATDATVTDASTVSDAINHLDADSDTIDDNGCTCRSGSGSNGPVFTLLTIGLALCRRRRTVSGAHRR